jgi:hypothetical protein
MNPADFAAVGNLFMYLPRFGPVSSGLSKRDME